MATVRTSLDTSASAEEVWTVIRDIGAVHTRLAPGFVTDTKLEPGARVVTFINGMVIREPIVTIDDEARRLVWTAEGGWTSHYNASLQVSARRRRRRNRRLDRRLPAGRRQTAIGESARGRHAGDEAVAGRARAVTALIPAAAQSLSAARSCASSGPAPGA